MTSTLTEKTLSTSSLTTFELEIDPQVAVLIGAVYGKFCNTAPISHLAGDACSAAVRVGPDQWHAGHDRQKVDGKWVVGVMLTRRNNHYTDGTKSITKFFLPIDLIKRVKFVAQGYEV